MAEKEIEMAEFKVVADSLWHSGECRPYKKGDIVKLPANTKVTDESSIARVVAEKPEGKGKVKGDDKDAA
jgi:hypothetical protein